LTDFFVFPGESFERWRASDAFRAPGGGPIAHWRDLDDVGLIAVCKTEASAPERPRWRRAQRAEIAFWRNWRRNVLYQKVSLEAFWEDVIEKTGGPLTPGKVLDVGCGPVSALNFHRVEGLLPIGVDPLAEAYVREGLVEARAGWRPMTMAAGTGERLPFADAAFDQLLCFNVLDHVADAPAVLREMRRVLKPGGEMRVYVHTFAAWIKRCLFFDRPHTYHWSHGEFRDLAAAQGFEVERDLAEPKSFDIPPGLWSKLRYLPYVVASKVAATSYFRFRRSRI